MEHKILMFKIFEQQLYKIQKKKETKYFQGPTLQLEHGYPFQFPCQLGTSTSITRNSQEEIEAKNNQYRNHYYLYIFYYKLSLRGIEITN